MHSKIEFYFENMMDLMYIKYSVKTLPHRKYFGQISFQLASCRSHTNLNNESLFLWLSFSENPIGPECMESGKEPQNRKELPGNCQKGAEPFPSSISFFPLKQAHTHNFW
jgi:hypothetical protein